MAEYIKREDALPDAFCCGISCQECPFLKHHVYGGCKIEDFIKAIPAADVVERKKGKWEWDGGEDMHYYCSCCHHNAYGCTTEILDGTYNYCPNCGADMRGWMVRYEQLLL